MGSTRPLLAVTLFAAAAMTSSCTRARSGAEGVSPSGPDAGLTTDARGRVCDVRTFGAKGDGTTKDTAALQAAIDRCAGGGVVRLDGGTFLSGMITLGSDLTLRIERGATLRGTQDDADYPETNPPTPNTQLYNCRRALVYAAGSRSRPLRTASSSEPRAWARSGTSRSRTSPSRASTKQRWLSRPSTVPMWRT